MNQRYQALAGTGLAVLANGFWDKWPDRERFKLKVFKATSLTLDGEKSPLAFIEHYHYGLGFLIVSSQSKGNAFLDGIGTTAIFLEMAGDQPFGFGKSDFEVKGNLVLASLLIGLFLITLPQRKSFGTDRISVKR